MDIIIPELGEGIEGGDVVNILIKAGDTVTAEQAMFEMETGKATVDIPAPANGTIIALTVTEGQALKVGDVIGQLDRGAETAAPEAAEAAPRAPTAAASAEPMEMDILIPNLGENIDGGDVVSILVKPGQVVEQEQALLEMETGKATVEIPAPQAGTILSIAIHEGERKTVGDLVGRIRLAGAAPAAAEASAPSKAAAPAAAPTPAAAPAVQKATRPEHAPVPAAPSVRKFAREIGIVVGDVPGSGPRGRISLADVKAYAKALNSASAKPTGSTGLPGGYTPQPLPDFSAYGEIENEPMNKIRKMTVEHMSICWGTVPHVTQHDYADVTDLEALRKSFKGKAEEQGAKLTLTAMLIKVLASALKIFPKFNATIDLANEQVIYKKYVNIGVAVDTPNGLVVPVIRNCDGLNMIEIAQALGKISEKMRSGKIAPSELMGGSMTLSNIGGLGGKTFTPIVNVPEVAILGIGRATMQPVWQGDKFEPRLILPLSLSYDHRLIDGADGTRFLRWMVDAIEQPLMISLEG